MIINLNEACTMRQKQQRSLNSLSYLRTTCPVLSYFCLEDVKAEIREVEKPSQVH